jgi:hypothetical protein
MTKTWIALVALVTMVSVAGTTVAFAELESQVTFKKCSVHSKKC